MKKIQIKNKSILNILDKKKDISEKQAVILEEMRVYEEKSKACEKEFNTLLTKAQMIDEKAKPLIKEIVDKIELEEFEEISKVHQDEDGTWNIIVANRLEEFKKWFKDQKAIKPEDVKEVKSKKK